MHRRVWIGKATLHFCIISWISSVKAGGQCRSHLSVNGETLKGHTFASSLVNRAIECSIKCENEPRCQSYNYVISPKLCELNNRTKDAKPLDLVPDPNRLYMTRWIDRVPLGSIPELPAESCSEIKASEGKEAPSTAYWLDPLRTGNIIRVLCDMISEACSRSLARRLACPSGEGCVPAGDDIAAHCSKHPPRRREKIGNVIRQRKRRQAKCTNSLRLKLVRKEEIFENEDSCGVDLCGFDDALHRRLSLRFQFINGKCYLLCTLLKHKLLAKTMTVISVEV
ncbi:hypothetical protein ACROYT_G036319 [Oculina patagonica]